MVFTSLADSAFDVCFENNLASSSCKYPSRPNAGNSEALVARYPLTPDQTRDQHSLDTSSLISTLALMLKTGLELQLMRS
jgi:hypothetical protein